MKLKIAIIFGLSCLVIICSARPAEEYDNEAAPVPPKQSARANLLNRRSPLTRAASPKGGSTTTTTTTLAPDTELEEEAIDENQPQEEVQVETSSTTEASRRIKGGMVRPFRTNQDLLEILKKKREQAVLNKANAKHQEAEEAASAAAEPEKTPKRPSAGRGRYNKKEAPAPVEEEPSSTQSSRASGARRFRS